LSHKTDNLRLAIVLLGFAEVRKIALKNYVSQTVGGKESKEYDTKQLWEHSYLVSTCAEIFSTEDDQLNRGTLMTLGLMHDVSKFALYNLAIMLKEKGISPQGIQKLSESSYLLEKEEKLFEVNHTIVGGLLAKKWNLSERFISVLECHHYPSFFDMSEVPQEYVKEIAAISISDYLVNVYSETLNILPMPAPGFFEIIGLKPSPDDILSPEVVAKLDKAKNFMGFVE
ncbi:HDOD domain-containing protein, partial [Candidatus Latescibacterota bacterium]